MVDLVSQLPLAFAAGLISVLSPCVLPLLPAFLALVTGVATSACAPDGERPARVRRACLGFMAGFAIVFVVMGLGAFMPGVWLRSWRLAIGGFDIGLSQVAGAGIAFLGLLHTRLLPRTSGAEQTLRSGAVAAAVGAGFGLGWSPCVGPILSKILSLGAARGTAGGGALLLSVYMCGLAVPFLASGRGVAAALSAGSLSQAARQRLVVASGCVLGGAGLLLLFNQFTRLNRTFSVLGDWIVALERALL